MMISLELAISNLQPTNYQQSQACRVCIKFASITTVIEVRDGFGGKCLYLNLSLQELQEVYRQYACALFIEKESARYFTLLSLQNVKVDDKVICDPIHFFNDFRELKFHCQFSINVKAYKPTTLTNTQPIIIKSNGKDLLKKPPLPKPSLRTLQLETPSNNNVPLASFLYGNQRNKYLNPAEGSVKTDHLRTMKEGIRKQINVVTNFQKSKHKTPKLAQQGIPNNFQSQGNESLLFELNPPAMEFINEERQQKLSVPELAYIQYQTSTDQQTKHKFYTKQHFANQSKFKTFNHNNDSGQHYESPQRIKQFELMKGAGQRLTRQEIKRLAKEEGQNREGKDNVMIPIAKGNKYELIPLSKMKPQQIIDYVQKQKKLEQQASRNDLKAKRLSQRQRELEEQNMKLNLRRQWQSEANVRRNEKQIKSSLNKEIKEEKNESENNEEDYMSDFESMSVSNSAIRSRISSKPKNNLSKEQESVLEDQYSEQFESYSHSMISKTNIKHREESHSVSDYTQSYKSISQSNRK